MEEPEIMLAEPEEEEFDTGPEGLHQSSLHQPTPYTLQQIINNAFWFVTSYGWLTVGVLVAAFYLRRKYGPRLEEWQSRHEEYQERAVHHKDPDKFLSKERALDAARRRMQEQYDIAARENAEKRRQKEEEEKQRQAQERAQPKQSTKKSRLKPEFYPLMGDTGGGTCGWRPSAGRGGAGGG